MEDKVFLLELTETKLDSCFRSAQNEIRLARSKQSVAINF